MFFLDVEHLKVQRERLDGIIVKEEIERRKILKEIEQLNSRLTVLNESISDKGQMRDDCDRTLEQAENGLKKIIESSHILLTLVQKESNTIKF